MLLLSISISLPSRVLCSFKRVAPNSEWMVVATSEGFLGKMSPELSLAVQGQPEDSEMKKLREGHSNGSITF